jgi:hypothetical protein
VVRTDREWVGQGAGAVDHRRQPRQQRVRPGHVQLVGTGGIAAQDVPAAVPEDHTAGAALLLGPLSALAPEQARAFFETRYCGALWSAKHAAVKMRSTTTSPAAARSAEPDEIAPAYRFLMTSPAPPVPSSPGRRHRAGLRASTPCAKCAFRLTLAGPNAHSGRVGRRCVGG